MDAWRRMIRAQGGDPDVAQLPVAPVVREAPSPAGGYVEAIATTDVGLASLHLGAGRLAKDDEIDHSVGIVCRAKRGDEVRRGDPLAEIHASDEAAAEAGVAELQACYRIGGDAPEPRPIVLETIGGR